MIEWIVLGAVIACVAIIILSGLPRSHAPRELGFAEGIDDEAVGKAFNAIQNLPQFKLVRGIIIKHIAHPRIGEPPSPGSSLLDLGCGIDHSLLASVASTYHERLRVDWFYRSSR